MNRSIGSERRMITGRNQGFTLVEVIVGIALLGIIAIAFLAAMGQQYSMMIKSRKMTKDTFSAQQKLEDKIEDVKTSVEKNETPSGQVDFVLFDGAYERVVKAYVREQTINDPPLPGGAGRKLYTVIADKRTDALTLATVTANEIAWRKGSDHPYSSYSDVPALSAAHVALTTNDPDHVLSDVENKWYVSRPGFYAPVEDTILEAQVGRVYPKFPDDYQLIAGVDAQNFTAISDTYAGRHLLRTVTPYTTFLKLGAETPSNPVYLSGVPFSDKLSLHLDASLVDPDAAAQVRAVSGTRYLASWLDMQGVGYARGVGQQNNAAQATEALQPELKTELMGTFLDAASQEKEIHARYAAFSSNRRMTVAKVTTVGKEKLTIYAAFRTTETTVGTVLFGEAGKNANAKSWTVGVTETDRLGLTVSKSDSVIAKADVHEGLDGEWHILTATVTGGAISLQIDRGPVHMVANTITGNGSEADLGIGWDGKNLASCMNADIGELVIYNDVLTAEQDDKAYAYFNTKYTPTAPVLGIGSFQHVVKTVMIGDSCALPATLPANMSNGSVKEKPVNWTAPHKAGDAVDTSVPGSRVFQATDAAGSGKTGTFTVNTLAIQSLQDQTIKWDMGVPFDMPTHVTALLSNGSLVQVPVDSWLPTTIDTSAKGTYTAIGKVIDHTVDHLERTMTLTVDVVDKQVRGVTLDKTTAYLGVAQELQLNATVSPADAVNKGVVWSSSDAAAVSVSSTGKIKGLVNGGKATITVTTLDGGFQATCAVEVVMQVSSIAVSPTSATLKVGDTAALTATLLPANATVKTVFWSSSNTAVATVSPTGRVTAWGSGNATITATSVSSGKTATCAVRVDPVALTKIEVVPDTLAMTTGTTSMLGVVYTPANASDRRLTWTSSDTRVVTVSNTGVVTAVKKGTAKITATATDGGKKDTCDITATALPPTYVNHVGASDGMRVELTLNKAVAAATINSDSSVTRVTVTGDTITFQRLKSNNPFWTTEDYRIDVDCVDGGEASFLLRCTKRNGVYTYSITNW